MYSVICLRRDVQNVLIVKWLRQSLQHSLGRYKEKVGSTGLTAEEGRSGENGREGAEDTSPSGLLDVVMYVGATMGTLLAAAFW